ncbi:hypothetical protein RRG08_019012 [Elysia crispata]|uniref:Uncharacterized protein n=1 Tax=Elysia crispata TaxID=231223 RepID=A0AAE1A668_9GAST|nr:hypothetical protein RRG08_019012 [Elysia crispata]
MWRAGCTCLTSTAVTFFGVLPLSVLCVMTCLEKTEKILGELPARTPRSPYHHVAETGGDWRKLAKIGGERVLSRQAEN